jgi:hypothetical protein
LLARSVETPKGSSHVNHGFFGLATTYARGLSVSKIPRRVA